MCLPPSVFQTKHNVRSQTEELRACVCLHSYLVFLQAYFSLAPLYKSGGGFLHEQHDAECVWSTFSHWIQREIKSSI